MASAMASITFVSIHWDSLHPVVVGDGAERLAEDLLQRLKSGVANGPAGASLDLWPVQVGEISPGPGPYLQHHGGFHSHGATPKTLDGWFQGKSH